MSHQLLLVDDERDFLRACSAALSRRGFAVTTAIDGESALEILATRCFDAAVLDVKMPGIDGVELFRRISLRWPELPVILLTGHGSLEQAFRTSREGVFDYLSKPVDMLALVLVVHRAIREAERRRQVTEAGGSSSGPGATESESLIEVLIVDDEPDLREALTAVLSRRFMTVTTAATGEEALRVVAQRVFDVIVLDLKLPDADGLEILRRLKQRSPLTEVIVLTGHPSVAAAVRGLRLGAMEFFVKPHDPESLARTIRQAFFKGRARAEEELQRLVDEAVSKSPS